MPEAYKGGVHPMGGGGGASREKKEKARKRFEKRITLPMLIDWINQQNYDDYTKKALIKKVSSYPYSSFKYFADSINEQIKSIRAERDKLRKEQDERERTSMQVSDESRVDQGSGTAELPGGECFDEGPTAGLPGSYAKEASDGESDASSLPS
jgi:hypothetical protein